MAVAGNETHIVSVCVITYQHREYIGQCLDSILMQRTNFKFEILVGEDASTDGTREICLQYEKRFPDRIVLFLRSREDVMYIGGQPTGRFNFLENLKSSRSKYIALCEGDDFWTDPLKLQKQVDFMEGNPHCSGVFADIVLVDAGGNFIEENRRVPTGHYHIETNLLMQGNAIHTSSFLFKRDIINQKAVNFLARMPYVDMPLYLLCSLAGPIGYLPDLMSAYRVNVGRMRHVDKAQRARNGMIIRESIIKEFGKGPELRNQYKVGMKKYYLNLSSGEFRNGRFIRGFATYTLFWWSTIYRISPRYPIFERISLNEHFQPLRECLGFLKRRMVTKQS